MTGDAEERLFRAYSSVTPGKPSMFRVGDGQCQCGGRLSLGPDESVADLMERHQDSQLHRAWRRWREVADVLQREGGA